jgi:hypothetical protein
MRHSGLEAGQCWSANLVARPIKMAPFVYVSTFLEFLQGARVCAENRGGGLGWGIPARRMGAAWLVVARKPLAVLLLTPLPTGRWHVFVQVLAQLRGTPPFGTLPGDGSPAFLPFDDHNLPN